MWLISARDLQFRLRRFVVAVMVTGLVFGIALVFDGVKRSMRNEGPRIVQSFGADQWVVARGASGPFTSTKLFPASVVAALRANAGVRRADPVVLARSVVATDPAIDVNLIGQVPGGIGTPSISEGRAIRRSGEVVIGAGIDANVGDRLGVGGRRMRVVGTTSGSRFYFGNPTVFATLRDAQSLLFGGEQLVMAVPIVGHVDTVPEGLAVQSVAHAEADLGRPVQTGIQTIDFVNLLLWLIAAGIIASIVYLSALERVRDFAVFKATGAPARTIVGGLLVQSTFLSLVAATIAVAIAQVVRLGLPFPAEIEAGSVALLGAIAIAVGVLASLAGVRRALSTDPAVAFGAAA